MMMNAPSSDDLSMPESAVSRGIAVARLVVGSLQGILLYALYIAFQHKTWPATESQLFAPLLLVALFIPIIFVSGLGHIGLKRIVMWVAAASAIAWGVGFYDVWRRTPDGAGGLGYAYDTPSILPSPLVLLFMGIGLYIAHSLVLAATADRQWIARYSSYFELAWKLAIQIKFSALFVGILWLVLWLGASLFMLVKLDFLKDLLVRPWFSVPITAFAFSAALHITDVRPGIVRGIRTLLLVLMSWLLPLATLIVFGFMASLPWTGLDPLWATRHATAVLLSAAAVLVVLINATFQNGEITSQVARILRWSTRVAAVLLAPIILIAIYSLGLRVSEYGWTTDRVIAAACLLVASCYATGYAWAAYSRGAAMRHIAPTNVVTAFVVLAVLVAMFSPAADPARISVANQLARLESGKVLAAQFDFDYIKFSGAIYGWDALQKLKVTVQGTEAPLIREKAAAVIAKRNQWTTEVPAATPVEIVGNITVWPKGSVLPASLLSQDWGRTNEAWSISECLRFKDRKCDAYLIDFTGDGKTEVLLIDQRDYPRPVLMMQSVGGLWDIAGQLNGSFVKCSEQIQKSLAAGAYQLVTPLVQDLEVAGRRLHFVPANRQINGVC